MASLYADENFTLGVVTELRQFGHDVLTALAAGQANQQIPDPQVLAYATSLGRALLTHDRDFIKLHTWTAHHSGIILCTQDDDFPALGQRIQQALTSESPLDNKLVRVNKPARP